MSDLVLSTGNVYEESAVLRHEQFFGELYSSYNIYPAIWTYWFRGWGRELNQGKVCLFKEWGAQSVLPGLRWRFHTCKLSVDATVAGSVETLWQAVVTTTPKDSKHRKGTILPISRVANPPPPFFHTCRQMDRPTEANSTFELRLKDAKNRMSRFRTRGRISLLFVKIEQWCRNFQE